jgi:hypothetical protein
MIEHYRMIANKKYIWDGKTYQNESEALNAAAQYKKDNFDVQLIKEGGKQFIYTRRAVVATQTAS